MSFCHKFKLYNPLIFSLGCDNLCKLKLRFIDFVVLNTWVANKFWDYKMRVFSLPRKFFWNLIWVFVLDTHIQIDPNILCGNFCIEYSYPDRLISISPVGTFVLDTYISIDWSRYPLWDFLCWILISQQIDLDIHCGKFSVWYSYPRRLICISQWELLLYWILISR